VEVQDVSKYLVEYRQRIVSLTETSLHNPLTTTTSCRLLLKSTEISQGPTHVEEISIVEDHAIVDARGFRESSPTVTICSLGEGRKGILVDSK